MTVIVDPTITQGIFMTMMIVLSGSNMEPLAGPGDIAIISDSWQDGLGFKQIEVDDYVVVRQKADDSKYHNHYIAQVVDIIRNHTYPLYGELRHQDLLVVQGIQDSGNPLDDYEDVQDVDWSADWRIVSASEYKGQIVHIVHGGADDLIGGDNNNNNNTSDRK